MNESWKNPKTVIKSENLEVSEVIVFHIPMQVVQLPDPDSMKARPARVFTQQCFIVIDPKLSPEPPLQSTLALHDTTEPTEM